MDGRAGNADGATNNPEILGVDVLVRGRKFDFVRSTVRGRDGGEFAREYVRHPGAVLVVAIKRDGSLVMVKNHRAAMDAWVLECCAGTLEPGEKPEECAARELIEETGYQAGRLEPLGVFRTSPGLTDELMHAFVGTDLEWVGIAPEADEWLEVVELPARDVGAMLESGELVDAKTMLALLMAARRGLVEL